MDWSKLPDLGVVALLTCAFASVARRSRTQVWGLWLTGWIMIALHFAVFIFVPTPGYLGAIAEFIGTTALIWAGVLFSWSADPHRANFSCRYLLAILLGTTALYAGLLVLGPVPFWARILAAALIGVLPLALTLLTLRKLNHPLRWATVILYGALSIFLLSVQLRPGDGVNLALNAVLCAVYLDCGIHFWYAYRNATAGSFVTIAGFLAWASLFAFTPALQAILFNLQLESEVWDLPEYVVAVGMILLLLEDQIEYNKFLALHDELTELPNRRLFQDRLASTIERARRNGSHAALLLVDLNQFKQVNDTHGHHVGDLLLKSVGTLFAGRVRRSDTVARTGGDEFSIILEEPANREDAERVAQSLLALLSQPLALDGHEVRVGASVGIAVFPEDALTMEALCIAADRNMYNEKLQSRRGGRQARPILSNYPSGSKAEAQSGI